MFNIFKKIMESDKMSEEAEKVQEYQHLTIKKCLEKLKEEQFKELWLTQDEFIEFIQIIPKSDYEQIQFYKPYWKGIPIKIKGLTNE